MRVSGVFHHKSQKTKKRHGDFETVESSVLWTVGRRRARGERRDRDERLMCVRVNIPSIGIGTGLVGSALHDEKLV